MHVVITGATGFIGRALYEELHKDYEIIALSRHVDAARQSIGHLAKVVEWDAKTPAGWQSEADGADAIINLAGENLGASRWDETRKSRILQSRLDSTNAVIAALKNLENKPKLVVLASAIGYYGPRKDEQLDETSPSGDGFLAEVCRQIESLANEVESLGVRCVIIRSGVVLGRNGGALAKLAQPFRFFLGGYLGSGDQWFSWISMDDEIAAIRFLMEHEELRGAFNLTAPQPVTMKEFCKTLGKVLRRPAWTRVPAFVLRLALGEMADEMLLSGQRVLPKRLLEAGFEFHYPDAEKTLHAIIN
jgi:uncharacterized protein (TIGR01777 family)